MAKAASRVYVVSNNGTDYLVRAANQAQALKHIVKSYVEVRVASQDDLLLLAGTLKVQEASSEI